MNNKEKQQSGLNELKIAYKLLVTAKAKTLNNLSKKLIREATNRVEDIFFELDITDITVKPSKDVMTFKNDMTTFKQIAEQYHVYSAESERYYSFDELEWFKIED